MYCASVFPLPLYAVASVFPSVQRSTTIYTCVCVCIVNYVLVSNVFTMNKCISIHIWCSSKSVSECVRKIIIYHIILFCRCCCCCSSGALFLFICIYLYFLGFFNLFLFFILCRLFITCGILKTLKRVPSRKFQIVF